jgi:hypothetical protein
MDKYIYVSETRFNHLKCLSKGTIFTHQGVTYEFCSYNKTIITAYRGNTRRRVIIISR